MIAMVEPTGSQVNLPTDPPPRGDPEVRRALSAARPGDCLGKLRGHR
ncbi:hypothetical protein ACFC1R_28545 [Kitasatospora sp. NPDC056138]